MSWRKITDVGKTQPYVLKLADWLGRGRGRMRFLDHAFTARPAPGKPDLTQWNSQKLAAVWIGHATVLLRLGELTILTDPALANRIGIGLGLITGGPHRHFAPALSLRELPPLDLILLSHAHFDHLDRPTLARLPKNVPVITSPHTRDLIDDLGFRKVSELRWNESLRLGDVTVTAREVKHWGARTFYDSHRGFNGYLLESAGRRVLYGADTAFGEHFREIGNVDLAILGIGAYDPYIRAHANPEQVWQMAEHLRAAAVLPMHHSTFKLSHEPMHEPMQRLLTAAASQSDRIVVQEVGGQWSEN